jgi:hypothetical protein
MIMRSRLSLAVAPMNNTPAILAVILFDFIASALCAPVTTVVGRVCPLNRPVSAERASSSRAVSPGEAREPMGGKSCEVRAVGCPP